MGRIADREAERLGEQDRIDRRSLAGERNRTGQFATPNPLAIAIARHLVGLRGESAEPIRFLDPSVGTGSFYSALRQVVPTDQIGSSVGVELDPEIAGTAERLWGRSGLEVIPGDFTRLEPPAPGSRANLILANPPYVRHHHLDRLEKQRLQDRVNQRLGAKVSGLAGLYAYFLLLADQWLEPGGLAAWLIPSEFMDVNYGTAIKDYLTDRVRLRQIHRFRPDEVQFADALVTSAVVVFEKAEPRDQDEVRMSLGGSIEDPGQSEFVPLSALKSARKWTRPFRVSEPSTTLGDLFTIRRGLVTGSNSFFILSPEEARSREIPTAFLRPILPSPRSLHDPIIPSDDQGSPAGVRSLVLLDCDLPESEVRRDHPALWAYLQEGVARGLNQGYLTSRRTPWYRQERRAVPPFVCTYMGRHRGGRPPFRIFWNRSRAVAANVYLLLYPRGPLARILEFQPELIPLVFERLQAIRPDHFLDEGRVYGGGLHKLEPKELASLPVDLDLDGPGAWQWSDLAEPPGQGVCLPILGGIR